MFFEKIQKKISRITDQSIKKIIFKNIIGNIDYAKKGLSVANLRNFNFKKKGKIALVVGGGPSLRKNNFIKKIKKIKKKIIIISTDGSLFYLLSNGIIPDLVITLDPHKDRILRWFGDEKLNLKKLKLDDYFRRQDIDIKFRDEISTNKRIIKLLDKYGKKIKIAACTSIDKNVVKRLKKIKAKIFWWHPFLDNPSHQQSLTRKIYKSLNLPIINSLGNVGSAGWVFAESIFGLKKICLLGMDCSYYIDTPLEQTQYYDVLKFSFGKKNIKKFYKKIYNPYLKTFFYTDHVYFWYRKILMDAIKTSKTKTYNCSQGGIVFQKPIVFTQFDDFLKKEFD